MLHSKILKAIVTVLCLFSFCICINVAEATPQYQNKQTRDDIWRKLTGQEGIPRNPGYNSVGSNEREDYPGYYKNKNNQQQQLEIGKSNKEQQPVFSQKVKDTLLAILFLGVPPLILLLFSIKKKYPLFNLIPKIVLIPLLVYQANFLSTTEFCELLTFIISLITVYEIGYNKIAALPFYLIAIILNPIKSFSDHFSESEKVILYLVIAIAFFAVTLYLIKTFKGINAFSLNQLKDFKKVVMQEPGNKFCTNCGKELPKNVQLCTYCGVENKIIDIAENTSESKVIDSENKQSHFENKVYTSDDPTYANIFSDTGMLKPAGRRGRWDYFKVCVFWTLIASIVSIGNIIVSTIIFTYTDFVNTAKRLHDLNHSTKWAILLSSIRLVMGLYLDFVVFMYEKNKDYSIILDSIPITIAVLITGLLPEIYFMFFKGTTGPNDYGPDPLQRIQNNSSL